MAPRQPPGGPPGGPPGPGLGNYQPLPNQRYVYNPYLVRQQQQTVQTLKSLDFALGHIRTYNAGQAVALGCAQIGVKYLIVKNS